MFLTKQILTKNANDSRTLSSLTVSVSYDKIYSTFVAESAIELAKNISKLVSFSALET